MTTYSDDKTAPVFQAGGLKRKNLTFAGDVIINGDLSSTGQLIIGGNLTVSGSCRLNSLICLGNVTVGGDLRFGHLRMRGMLVCKGHLVGEDLFVTNDVLSIRTWELYPKRERDVLAFCQARSEDPEMSYAFEGGISVDVGGVFDVDEFDIFGGVKVVGDAFNVDGQICGSFECLGDVSGEALWVYGEVYAMRKITLFGKLLAAKLFCRQSCTAGTIEVDDDMEVGHAIVADGDVVVSGHIKSGNRIQTRGVLRAGKSIQSASSIFASKGVEAGRDYGIYAGLDVSHALGGAHGYIACRVKPRFIKTGAHIKGKRFKELTERQLVSWPASDGSDGL